MMQEACSWVLVSMTTSLFLLMKKNLPPLDSVHQSVQARYDALNAGIVNMKCTVKGN
jgi:hypothetical protein